MTLLSPGGGFHGPDAVTVFLLKLTCQGAEHRVVVRPFVVADTFPVESLGRRFRIRITIEHFRVPAFRISPVFVHESNSSQAQL